MGIKITAAGIILLALSMFAVPVPAVAVAVVLLVGSIALLFNI